ncbi:MULTISPECIES: serine/threonine-protein kinase [Nocardioides]|uniref:non-specific serine/threonine protein kinase n=1 Tax=Nocardioides vastitatis TaxID=2568655 RepID=A0ABW0ZDN2_9ACTN|nr:serine/threonine-protein kinase [Nocardioides sp.]THI97825.1 serine/threonine protein kinase [Nocardioides sp.]
MTGTDPRPGDWLGRYQLVEVLGRGGMGTVYRAHDPQLERDVALKVINPALADDGGFRERFRREAMVLSRMDSDHVVSVYDHGEQDGAPFLVTQLVRGGDLLSLLRTRGALEPSYALDLVAQVLRGLADAHAAGVVHRDVKPSNVLLKEDLRTAYLCDFGIASSPGQQLTQTGVLVGSSAYMAPERHAGETAASSGVAADVYAVGCLLWHVLTDSQPYVGTEAEVAMGHLRGPIPQLPGREDFVTRFNALMRRSMAKDPRHRYPSARAMLADLTSLRAVVPGGLVLPEVTSVRQPVVGPSDRLSGRRRALAVTVVAVLVAGGAYVGSLVGGVEMAPSVLATDPGTSPVDAPDPTGATREQPGAQPSDTSADAPSAADEEGRRDQGVVEEPPGAVEEGPEVEPRVETSADGRRPRPAPSRSDTRAPSPTAAPSSASPSPSPTAQYRCWNGREVVRRSSCTSPVNWRGATWVFPSAASTRGCTKVPTRARAQVEAWRCTSKARDGTTKVLAFHRWTSARAAAEFYWSRLDPSRHRARGPWTIGGKAYGRFLLGRTKAGHAETVRVYGAAGTSPWVVIARASTPERRSTMMRNVTFRDPSYFRAVPLD